MASAPKLKDYYDSNMNLSLSLPEGWQVTQSEQFLRMYIAPKQDNYQANLSMNVSQSNGAPPEAMDTLLQQTDEQRKQQDKTYKQTHYEKLMIDGNPARLRHYEWSDAGTGLQFAQIQALIIKGPLLLVIDGASLKKNQNLYIPLFDTMVKSIRFIQAQPS